MTIQIGCTLNHKRSFKVYYQIKEECISVIRYVSQKSVLIFPNNIPVYILYILVNQENQLNY